MNPSVEDLSEKIRGAFKDEGFPSIELDFDQSNNEGTATIKGSSPFDYPKTPHYGPRSSFRRNMERLLGPLDISVRCEGFLQAMHAPQIPTVTVNFKEAPQIDLTQEEI